MMLNANDTRGCLRFLRGIRIPACFILLLCGLLLPSPMASIPRIFGGALGTGEVFAQAINPQAKSKYEAGVAAMNRGDCAGARALLEQAVALDPTDRSVRVGMFSTDYFPNAQMKALETKCGTAAPAPAPATAPLALTLASPQGSALSVQNEVDSTLVQGTVQGGTGGFRVSVNGRDVGVDGAGRFSASVPLSVGANDIAVRATDSSNKIASKSVTVTRLAKAPPSPGPVPTTPPPPITPPTPAVPPSALELAIISPVDAKLAVPAETESVEVKGAVKGGAGREKVFVNGRETRVESNGSFAAVVAVKAGANRVSVKATDASGATREKQLVITRAAAPAAPAAPLALNVTAPVKLDQSVGFETDKLSVGGTVTGGEGTPRVTVNNKPVTIDKRGAFSIVLPLSVGENTILVKARDAAGKEEARELRVTRAAKVYPPPSLIVTAPGDSRQSVPFETDKVMVKGSISGGEGASKLTVNDREVKVDAKGGFSAPLALEPGENRILVSVRDAGGREDSRELWITREAKVYPPPVLTVTAPAEPRQTVAFETDSVTVKGTTTGGEGTPRVTVNDREIRTDAKGAFLTTVALETGENRLIVQVRDAAGREDSRELWITRQAKVYPPPALSVTSPVEPRQTVAFETDSVAVKGTVTGGEGAPTVTVNDREVRTDARGAFSTTVALEAGENRLIVKVRDGAGREDSRELRILRQEKVYPPPSLTVTAPTEPRQTVAFETDSLTVKGVVTGGEGTPTVTVNNREVRTDAKGAFSTAVTLDAGENTLTVTVRDAAGREESRELRITRLAKVYPPPVLTVSSPSESKQTVAFETDTLTVKGSFSGGEGTSRVTVNDREVGAAAGAFSVVIPLTVGENRITAKVRDSVGREDVRSFLVTRRPDERAPLALTVDAPTEKGDAGRVNLSGTVSGGKEPLRLIVDGRTVQIGEAGAFTTSVALRTGKNRILVRVEDAAGKHEEQLWFLFHYPTVAKQQ